jgi:hypothetical protein
MIHRIDDVSFQSGWKIVNVQLAYQSFGFKMSLNDGEYQILQQVAGYNIYGLSVPIVAE